MPVIATQTRVEYIFGNLHVVYNEAGDISKGQRMKNRVKY